MTPLGGLTWDPCSVHTNHNHAQPVFKLHSELLWYILSMTVVDHDSFVQRIDYYRPNSSALARARYLSQVCSVWRGLVLSSSSLWANSIELDYLNQRQGYWREEVIRRTGRAPLSIMGTVREERHSTHFVLDLLSNEWSRIRRLNIFVSNNVSHDHRWSALVRPAYNLELLHISFFDSPASGFLAPEPVLFSDNAPNLQSLRFEDAKFKLAGSWISQLRKFSFRGNITGHTLFHSLREMQALEVLEVDNMISESKVTQNDWPIVTLSRLEWLGIYDRFHVVNSVLQHIVPPAGCNLYIESMNTGTLDVTPGELSVLSRSVVGYFKSYSAQIFKTNCLSFFVTDEQFVFDIIKDPWAPPSHPRFKFGIEASFTEASYAVPRTIFHAMSSCDLSMVTTLDLDLTHFEIEPDHIDLISLMKALSHVEVLQTQSETLKFLVNSHDNPGLILPSLHTIVFDTGCEIQSDVVIRFIIRRREAQVPIKVFDLTKCSSFGQAQLLFLEGIDGLKVVWNDGVRDKIEDWRRGECSDD